MHIISTIVRAIVVALLSIAGNAQAVALAAPSDAGNATALTHAAPSNDAFYWH